MPRLRHADEPGSSTKGCGKALSRVLTPASYNQCVSSMVPSQPAPEEKHPDSKHEHHHATYAAEATGLLLMAVLLLILTIIRYWRYIPWGAR